MHASPHSPGEDVAHLLGRRLRHWREARNLPLRHLADRLGVTCATISCWECGKRFPSGKHIDGLAALTELEPCYFFCRSPEACPVATGRVDSPPPPKD